MIEIELEKRYPLSRVEDITDAFMRGYEAGRKAESIWREKVEVAFADRKTENSSEKPNNCEECEHWNDTEDGCADRHGCKDEPQKDFWHSVTKEDWLKAHGLDEPKPEQTDCPWK